MAENLPPEPLFLERQNYRRRRLMDAARLLPVAGAVAWFLPLLWAGPAVEDASTANGGIYMFAVWAVLIGVAAVLSRRLTRGVPPPVDGD